MISIDIFDVINTNSDTRCYKEECQETAMILDTLNTPAAPRELGISIVSSIFITTTTTTNLHLRYKLDRQDRQTEF